MIGSRYHDSEMTIRDKKHILVTCAIIERDGLVLAAQRSAVMSMPLKWEFPGGKIKPDETPEKCFRRMQGRGILGRSGPSDSRRLPPAASKVRRRRPGNCVRGPQHQGVALSTLYSDKEGEKCGFPVDNWLHGR